MFSFPQDIRESSGITSFYARTNEQNMTLKVRSTAKNQWVIRLLLIIVMALPLGCTHQDMFAPESRHQYFGDPYRIILQTVPGEPDLPPSLIGDTLQVLVSYAGGCENHSFELDYNAVPDTTRLWMRHDAQRDQCEAHIIETVRIPVRAGLLKTPIVVLLNPDDRIPFILKW